MTKVLITGFEPNDNTVNASELVVTSLSKNPPPEISQYIDSINFKVLPGDTNSLEEVINELLQTLKPNVCIGIGQARGYNKIAIERMAKNLKYFISLDKMGNAPKEESIVPNAPIAYWNSLNNIEGLVSLLESHNIPNRITNDCGTHLCNQAFYHFLHWQKINDLDMKAGFIHIPALPQQVIKYWSEAPFMTMETICKAISIIVAEQIESTE